MNLNFGTLIGQSIAMIVFVWFCMKYIWPVIMNAIEQRQTEIANGLAAAEQGKSSLATAKVEVDKILAAARDQARGIIDQANMRATGIVEQAKADGEAARKAQVEAARAEIDVEINRAREELRASGLGVETGEFQAMMQVSLVNDGPVTILLDSRKTF